MHDRIRMICVWKTGYTEYKAAEKRMPGLKSLALPNWLQRKLVALVLQTGIVAVAYNRLGDEGAIFVMALNSCPLVTLGTVSLPGNFACKAYMGF